MATPSDRYGSGHDAEEPACKNRVKKPAGTWGVSPRAGRGERIVLGVGGALYTWADSKLWPSSARIACTHRCAGRKLDGAWGWCSSPDYWPGIQQRRQRYDRTDHLHLCGPAGTEKQAPAQATAVRKKVHLKCIGLICQSGVQCRKIRVWSAIFTAANYTYGPILGLFTFGLVTKGSPLTGGFLGGRGYPRALLPARSWLEVQLWIQLRFCPLARQWVTHILGLWLLTKNSDLWRRAESLVNTRCILGFPF